MHQVSAPSHIVDMLESWVAEPNHDPVRLRDLIDALASHADNAGIRFAAELADSLNTMVARGRLAEDTSMRILTGVLYHERATTDDSQPASIVEGPWSHLHGIVWGRGGFETTRECIDALMQELSNALQVDATTLFVKDVATDVMVLRANFGLPADIGDGVSLRVGRGIAGQSAQRRESISAEHAVSHPDFHSHEALSDETFASQLSSPLIVHPNQQIVGVINVHTRETRQFSRQDIEFLETIAGVLAISVDSVRQTNRTDEQMQQKVGQLATLQRVSRVIASSLDLSEVLKLITEQAFELIRAEAAAIFRLSYESPESRTPRPSVEYRIGPTRSHQNEAARDEVVAEVLRTGMGRSRDILYDDGTSTIFCLPLNTARETVGALCFRLRLGTRLDDDVLGLLQAFGDAAAIAIDNARLYQEAIGSIETQSALVQEMHHRVRNNLQTVAALLSLQLRSEQDAVWAFELREAITRIQAIAGVHDLLSDESRLGGTTLNVIAKMVAEDAHSTLIPPGLAITFEIPPSTLTVPSHQATIIALLINELTANAIHHGFIGRDRGLVTITGREDDGSAVIDVANDGVRIDAEFDPKTSTGLGMRITQRLVSSDLGGRFAIGPTESGTLATIRFPMARLSGEDRRSDVAS